MRTSGELNVWFQDRLYGFVHSEQGGTLISHFLHKANIKSGTPATGAKVSFKSVSTKKGYIAVDAEILSDEVSGVQS
jgi:cold shock CspA family protein